MHKRKEEKNHGNLRQVTFDLSQILISCNGIGLLLLHGNDPEVTCIVKTSLPISGHFLLQGKHLTENNLKNAKTESFMGIF